MKTYKKILALLMAVAAVGMMAACGSTAEEPAEAETEDAEVVEATTEEAAAPADAAGFTEYPIFEDEEIAFMNVSAVYFQAVPMSNGNENIEDFDIHLECDVSALENDLGYGGGDWIPYLTVDYQVIHDNGNGDVAAEGTFMVMSASDGPHYGANIALPDADTYKVIFTFHNPEENGYLIHTDAETGPGGLFDEYFADGNLTVEYEGWDYTPMEF